MRVRVFRNLRKHCWSIESKDMRRIIGHASLLVLDNCRFHVSEKGRQYSLTKRQQSDHAWVEGDAVMWVDTEGNPDHVVTILTGKYNYLSYAPKHNTSFVEEDGVTPVTQAKRTIFNGPGGIYALLEEPDAAA